jgi:hypothetical protein
LSAECIGYSVGAASKFSQKFGFFSRDARKRSVRRECFAASTVKKRRAAPLARGTTRRFSLSLALN